MPRFFAELPDRLCAGDPARVTGQDAVHIRRALRMREGESLILCDGAGSDYACVIEGFDGDAVVLRVKECRATTAEPSLQVTLYQGLPKGDKMDWIVQKAVELGVQRIVPVEMSRSVARLGANDAKKQERWQRIADEAAGQCGRGIQPQVLPAVPFRQAVQAMEAQTVIVFYEGGGRSLRTLADAGMREASLLIGPEGGIDDREVKQLRTMGAAFATLGPRILRCETAPVAALAALMALTGNME